MANQPSPTPSGWQNFFHRKANIWVTLVMIAAFLIFAWLGSQVQAMVSGAAGFGITTPRVELVAKDKTGTIYNDTVAVSGNDQVDLAWTAKGFRINCVARPLAGESQPWTEQSGKKSRPVRVGPWTQNATYSVDCTSRYGSVSDTMVITVSGSGSEDTGSGDQGNTTINGITYSVSTDKAQYISGDTITIKITARNTSSAAQTFQFRTGCQASYSIGSVFDIEPQPCTQSLTSRTVQPNTEYTWEFAHRSQDKLLTPGTYVITGRVIGYGSATTTITVNAAAQNNDPVPDPDTSTGSQTFTLKRGQSQTFSGNGKPNLTITLSNEVVNCQNSLRAPCPITIEINGESNSVFPDSEIEIPGGTLELRSVSDGGASATFVLTR